MFSFSVGSQGTPEEHSVRLVGSDNPAEGRVEIYHNSRWGSVCSDGWDIHDASVVCRMLGFSAGALRVEKNAFFGPGAGEIWLDDVRCDDADVVLAECANNGWGIHDCRHAEDAGVVCVPVVGKYPTGVGYVVLRGSRLFVPYINYSTPPRNSSMDEWTGYKEPAYPIIYSKRTGYSNRQKIERECFYRVARIGL